MECSACQRENRDGARYCDACGAALPSTCIRCGRILRSEARFCDGCGQPVGSAAPAGAATDEPAPRDPRAYTPKHLAERILTQKSALEGERKHVTVLFADVGGYTSLAERADPEEMHSLMDRCFQRILDEVHRFEGTVNQFTGDGVMALFGAPLALEDAPHRAVRAALGIQRSLVPLHEEVMERYGTGFRMRIGLHSGPVVVGRIGDDLRMDYTAVGDTTNLAARLQQAASPGEVWISDTTSNLVSGYFDLHDLGTLDLKGKRQPVQAFAVRAERAVSGRIEAAIDTGLTPLVGRDRELAALTAAFESAREAHGQAAMLVGEPGIGKSRVLFEFRSSLADEPHSWFEGRCSAVGTTTAFHPLADAVRRRFDIDDRDDEAGALAKIEAARELLGADFEWTLPYLRVLLSLPAGDAAVAAMDAMTRRSETFRALRAVLLAISERQPLVFVIEDLHWLDPASEEFLSFLVESVPAARVLLLFTYRPGYEHPFGDRSYHLRLALQPLSESAVVNMAGSLLEGADAAALPPELLELITGKAEGNPFFVEEVTKSLLEEGVLRLEAGRVELVRNLADVSVPDRIQDVLMARLDRLSEEPKRAIQVASVIGREFALRLLAQIREAGERIQDVVGELRTLELIYEKTAHPELAFMFKHALTHDVAYESILISRRRALHGIVGAAIEELYRDRLTEHYEALAHHFERAEDWERALEYHERAAEKAFSAYANHGVVEHCRRALAIVDQLGDGVQIERRIALEERLARAHFSVSEFGLSGEAYLQAAETHTEGRRRARNIARAALSFGWGHLYESQTAASERALALAREHSDPVAESLACVSNDLVGNAATGPEGRADVGAQALRLAGEGDDPEVLMVAYAQRALYLVSGGRFRDSIDLSDRALAIARKQENIDVNAIIPQWTSGLAYTCVGEYGRALTCLHVALEYCDRCGDRALKARLLNTLGWCHAEFGSHARAAAFNQTSSSLSEEMVKLGLVTGAPEIYANAAINLANDHTVLGDAPRARDGLARLRESLAADDDPWQRWRYDMHWDDAMARVALCEGDFEAALRHADAELAAALHHGTPKIQARAHTTRGRALLLMDRRDEAAQTLSRALEMADEIEYRPVGWRALALLSELDRRAGRDADADRRAGEARDRVIRRSESLLDAELQREFLALGDALASNPLEACR